MENIHKHYNIFLKKKQQTYPIPYSQVQVKVADSPVIVSSLLSKINFPSSNPLKLVFFDGLFPSTNCSLLTFLLSFRYAHLVFSSFPYQLDLSTLFGLIRIQHSSSFFCIFSQIHSLIPSLSLSLMSRKNNWSVFIACAVFLLNVQTW